MSHPLIDVIDKFAKKEIAPAIESMERSISSESLFSTITKASEIGINLLPLPEEHGGTGLNIPVMGESLRKISQTSAGFATIYMFHFAGLFPFLLHHKGSQIITALAKNDPSLLFGMSDLPTESITVTGGKIKSTSLNVRGTAAVKYVTLCAKINDKIAFVIVPISRTNVKTRERAMGIRPFCFSSVQLENIDINEENAIILSNEEGRTLTEKTIGLLFALTCAIATGNAEGAFTHAFKYASERYQGGEIIINHKIIQTLLGRIITRIEASLALTEKILNSAQAQNFDKAGIAKAFVTEACEWACSDCVQVFGGYGYMKDFSVERHLRDAKSLSGLLQGNMYNLQDYVRGLKEQGGTA